MLDKLLIILRSPVSTRQLSYVFASLFGLIGVVLFFPIREIFQGRWILNQKIDLFYLDNIGGFQVGQISLRYYALCLACGMIAGFFLSLRLSKQHFLVSTVIDRLFIGLIFFGIIGSRLLFVVFNWDTYALEPFGVVEITKGGLSFMGMLIAGLFYVFLYTKRFQFNTFEFLDFLAPGVLLGQIVGRFGNFFNYEAYGGPTKVLWRMYVPDIANIYDLNLQYYHPTFLYEIIPNALLLIGILFWYDKMTYKRSGLVFASYLIGYGFIRFITENFRLDALTVDLPTYLQFTLISVDFKVLYVSQLLALLMIVTGVLLIILRRKTIYLSRTQAEFRVKA
jgi:phosphatidylglycerol---prolipoprotein diacylglyceryl transferase